MENRLPLSGDVKQWIKAWGEVVGQVGLFNVNIANSADPAAEHAIVSRHSYGRQLGRILDVLEPLVLKNCSLIDEGDFDDFEKMVKEIRCLKPDKCLSPEQVVDAVRRWPEQLPNTYRQDIDTLTDQLRKIRDADGK